MWLIPNQNRRVVPSFHSVMDEFFRGATPPGGNFSPSLDIKEDESAYHVSVELPGMAKEDVNISLKDHNLVIEGEKKQEAREQKYGYSWVERSYGSFQRTIQIPENAKGDQVGARMENGVLEITLPKSDHREERKQIGIS